MERRTAAKPYFKAIANFQKHKEEIDVLPKKYHAVIARYVYSKGNYPVDEEDFFGNLVLYCMEADHATSSKNFYSRAVQIVEDALFKQRQEAKKLYNPYRNLFLDKYYGESKRTLGEWMDFSKEHDNDD